jgi:hypothetical protein
VRMRSDRDAKPICTSQQPALGPVEMFRRILEAHCSDYFVQSGIKIHGSGLRRSKTMVHMGNLG